MGQLHACAVEDICEAVGIDPKKYKDATAARTPARSYDPALKDEVVKAVLGGMTYKNAAEKFGVPQGNISVWVQKAKKKRAQTAAAADKQTAPPVAPVKEQAPPDRAFAQRILAELDTGLNGLRAFIDNFYSVDILSDDEHDVLERILNTSSGFRTGVETGFALACSNSRLEG